MEKNEDVNIKDYEVGAVVGRFQLSDLHDGHGFLIDTVVNNHKKVIILLGVTRALGTPENPVRIPSRENVLDFTSRQYMIQEIYPNVIVVPIQDKNSNEIWSEAVDQKIREVFPNEKVLLYGGRDSFIPCYHGKFDTKALDPEIYISATEVRNSVSKEVLKSSDFRSGQIYHAYQQTPVLYTNYKIAVQEDDKILFCIINEIGVKKSKFRLLEGLAGINDQSIEVGAKRVLGNLIGNLEVDTQYEMSKSKIEFGNKTHRVMNLLITAKKNWGSIKPQGNFTFQWFSIKDLESEGFMIKNIEEDQFDFVHYLINKNREKCIH